jgi:DNA-binding GntR family transcriptional regulator
MKAAARSQAAGAEKSGMEGEGDRRPATVRSANNVRELYAWVRAAILNGRIAADQPISQSQLAAEFGVSRTPLREALRMLQAEGLVVGELNQRMRVASLTAEGIDSLYAARIVLEAFGLLLTVPRLTPGEVTQIQQTLKHMNAHDWIGDRAAWEEHHNAFHGLLVMHVGTVLGSTMSEMIANFQFRAERHRRLYVSSDPRASAIAAEDHARIVEAIVRRDAGAAVRSLSEHLSRTALRLLAVRAPEFDAKAVRNALRLVAEAGSGDAAALLLAANSVPPAPPG